MGESLDTIKVDRQFIGAGCNKIVNCVSWGLCNLVAFGVHDAVAIFDPQTAQILITLPGHEDIVSSVEWLPRSKDIHKGCESLKEHYLLSGSVDGAIMIWGYLVSENKWRNILQVPKSHEKAVTCIAGLMTSKSEALFASTSSCGVVNVWKIGFPIQTEGDISLSLTQSIVVGGKAHVALSLAELPGEIESHVLAMGGLDNKVHLYTSENQGKFVHACELKGHQDWIRGLDFTMAISNSEENHVLIASSSQDRTLRIWKILLYSKEMKEAKRLENVSLKTFIEGPVFKTSKTLWQVSLESLLVGHEDWVYSVKWQPPSKLTDNWMQPQSILSASMDKTMMIWRPERKTGIWINEVTVGELSHSALGFYGGHWAPKGDSILAHGYGGAFHLWKNVGLYSEEWKPQIVPSGHFASVTDIAWAKSGQFILSCSHDQTTRIFAAWKKEFDDKNSFSWHEVARPQVHGHDINTVAVIRGEGNHRYVSGADEKVARVFEGTLSFLQTLQFTAFGDKNTQEECKDIQILGANMSALGLSQKPIFVHGQSTNSSKSNESASDFMESVPDAVPVVLREPPLEEDLGWNTLWPETHKLYGHGNELFAICCDHQGKLIATACKAQSSNVAEIWLWDVQSWRTVGRLHSHSLTVTQMEFSHDDRSLLSVSRDRHFSVFQLERKEDEVAYKLISKQDAHKRIIWSCSWTKCGYVFATGSRDRTVKLWKVTDSAEKGISIDELAVLPQFSSSITAVSWAPQIILKENVLAIGMENGLIELWKIKLDLKNHESESAQSSQIQSKADISRAIQLDKYLCHVATVNRLVWKENIGNNANGSCSLQLASCGADHTVRLFNILLG